MRDGHRTAGPSVAEPGPAPLGPPQRWSGSPPLPAGPAPAQSVPSPASAPVQPLRTGPATGNGASAGRSPSSEELVEQVLRRLDREITVAAERRGRRGDVWRGGAG